MAWRIIDGPSSAGQDHQALLCVRIHISHGVWQLGPCAYSTSMVTSDK